MVPSCRTDPDGEGQTAHDAPSILLVEDEILIRLNTADQLRAEGVTVIEAFNAEDAIAVLDSGVRIDVVLTDVRMPGPIDGLGLAHLIRSQWPQLKVIVCSGQDFASAIDARTADAFILKPHDKAMLMRLIRRLLEIEREH